MSIQLANNFCLRGQYPLDKRFLAGTKQQLLDFEPREAYDGLIKFCIENEHLYTYDTNYTDTETGHFKAVDTHFIAVEDITTITEPLHDSLYYQIVNTDDYISGLYTYDFENEEWKNVGGSPVDDITVIINEDKKLESYAIIDCENLPTDNIKENILYRKSNIEFDELKKYLVSDPDYTANVDGLTDITTGTTQTWAEVETNWDSLSLIFTESETGNVLRWKAQGETTYQISFGSIEGAVKELYFYKDNEWSKLMLGIWETKNIDFDDPDDYNQLIAGTPYVE